ncbi:MAG TPA: hypothetical protein VJ044_18145 [Candidatus Hodarchaeales archaeon]|nr:hypothetical protein [Candidatus Hodarchaeales archaeon]
MTIPEEIRFKFDNSEGANLKGRSAEIGVEEMFWSMGTKSGHFQTTSGIEKSNLNYEGGPLIMEVEFHKLRRQRLPLIMVGSLLQSLLVYACQHGIETVVDFFIEVGD